MVGDTARLVNGPRTKDGIDLSDIIRGRIVAYKEIITIKTQIMNANLLEQRRKQEENENK
jgi:hypothetical protein